MKKYLSFLIFVFYSTAAGNPSYAEGPCASVPPVVLPDSSSALPDASPKVTHGSLGIKTSGDSMHMHAGAGKTIANFDGFNIGPTADVNVHMGSNDAMLARDVSGDTSHIMGRLSIPQGFFALTGKDIAMHDGAIVNIGKHAGFVPIAGSVSDAGFLAGKMDITAHGSIFNAATINIKEKGFFGLFGHSVTQTGHIAGEMGTVSMAVGDRATLTFADNDLVGFVLPDENAEQGGQLHVTKDARIETNGGNVLLTAQAAEGVVESVVRVEGVVKASSMHKVGGKIILGGGDRLEVSGTVETTGDQAGDIITKGKHISIKKGAVLDVSGQSRAGAIQIGGRRIRNGNEAWLWELADITADAVEIEEGAQILARRYGDGRGDNSAGDIFVIARKNLKTKGARFDVRSWGKGDGGFIELSVLEGTVGLGDIDISDVLFKNYDETAGPGRLLFDPQNIVVGAGSDSDTSYITNTTIEEALGQGDVILNADNLIQVDQAITWDSRYSLLMAATHSTNGKFIFNDSINFNGTGRLLLYQTSTNPPEFYNDAMLGSTSSSYVIFSVPISSVSDILQGGDASYYKVVQGAGVGDGTSGVHLTENANIVYTDGSPAIPGVGGYTLTGFNPTDTTNFTESSSGSGYYTSTGKNIAQYTVTVGGVNSDGVLDGSDSMPFTGSTAGTNVLSFVKFNFPGTITTSGTAGYGAIAKEASTASALLVDRIGSLSVAGITGTATLKIGGLVGFNDADLEFNELDNVTIGNININFTGVGQAHSVGGLVGQNLGGLTIKNSTIDSIGAVSTGDFGLGGLVGNSFGSITINDVAITSIGDITGRNLVGGLIGQIAQNEGINSNVNISSLTIGTIGDVSGTQDQVGGLIGRNNGSGGLEFNNGASTITTIGNVTGGKANDSNNSSVGGLMGSNGDGKTANFDGLTVTTIGNVTGTGEGVGGLVGKNEAGGNLFFLGSTFTTIGNVSGASYVGGLVGLNAGSSATTTFDMSSTVGSVGNVTATATPSYVGGLFGSNEGNIAGTALMISSIGTISGQDTTHSAGLIGYASASSTATMTSFTLRSLTASGLNLFLGSGSAGKINLSVNHELFGLTAGNFDSGNATWAREPSSTYGVISGQLGTLPNSADTNVTDNIFLRFFDSGGSTFYQFGGEVLTDLSSAQTVTDGITTLRLNPQEEAGLPYDVIQFLTAIDQTGTGFYTTYRYNASDTTSFYSYDGTLIAEIIPPSSSPPTPTTTTTDDPNVSSDLEVLDDLGELGEAEGDVPVDDDLSEPSEEDIDDQEIGDDDFEDEESEADESDGDALEEEGADNDDEEEEEEEEKEEEENKNRTGGDILSLLEDSDNDDIPDVSNILRQRA